MKQASSLWQWAGFGLTTLGGTLLHFLYDWTVGSIWVAPFSGVNESTWEHMKLLFWPLFLIALVQWLFFRAQKNYWCVKLMEILLGVHQIFHQYNEILFLFPLHRQLLKQPHNHSDTFTASRMSIGIQRKAK